MAFNKAKALQAAERLVIQGKVSQAIKQYFDILDKDPSDVVLLNTIGDLYIRDKNVPEGLRQFYRLAEAYVQEEFTVKAIAIYRKIAKLEPNSVDPLLKLAELYQNQRLSREAREQYYQVAEYYKKKNQNDKALETLRKVVQLDVENATARARLATFCEEIGRKEEAGQVYLETAQLARRRGDAAAARTALNKAQELDPGNSQVYLFKAREALESKHPEEVEAILSALPGLKDDPAGLSVLIESYLSTQQLEKAEKVMVDLFHANPADFSPVASFVSACVQVHEFDTAFKSLSVLADELIEQDKTNSLLQSLRLIWSKAPLHIPTLELIYRICEEAGDEFVLSEILQGLGHAYMERGQFQKAEEAFQRLVEREPKNERYKALLKQAFQKQGKEADRAQVADLSASVAAPTPEEEEEEELASPAASIVPSAEREAMVKEALENSDLFTRYHLMGKAVAELGKVLEVYPDEIEIHQRLVEICWNSMTERAQEAAQALERIYLQRGNDADAKRYARLAAGQEAPIAGANALQAVAAPAVSPESLPPYPAQPTRAGPGEIAPASEFSLAPGQEARTSPTPQVPATAPVEFSFDLPPLPEPEASAPMPAEIPVNTSAPPAGELPASTAPGIPSDLSIPPALKGPPPAPSRGNQEIDLSEDWESLQAQKPSASLALETPQGAAPFNYDDSRIEVNFYLENGFVEEARKTVEELAKKRRGDPRIADLWALIEAHTGSLAADVREGQPAATMETRFPAAAAPPPKELLSAKDVEPRSPGPFDLFAEELGEEWGFPGSSVEPELEAQPAAATPAAAPVSPLSGLLEEMGEGPGMGPVQEDDSENHYNLGVAFREMNLLDEAIGEFQKVAKRAAKGHDPPNYLQACSLLAICFMEKGMAAVAAKWYLRALETPDLDEEAMLALQYDLGVAYEQAGNVRAAVEKFTEVYGQNIDFRDVAEKVRILRPKVT